MREARKKKLEAAGWKFGDADEFLGLTPEEKTLVEIKANLAGTLAARRERRGLTQAGAAKILRSSQSRVAKMEAGDASVSLDLLIRALARLGAGPGDLADALLTGPGAAPLRAHECPPACRAGGRGRVKAKRTPRRAGKPARAK